MLFSDRASIVLNRKKKCVVCKVTGSIEDISSYPPSVWQWSDIRILDFFWERYWG